MSPIQPITKRETDRTCESCQNELNRARVGVKRADYKIPGGHVFELPVVVEYLCAEHAAQLLTAVTP